MFGTETPAMCTTEIFTTKMSITDMSTVHPWDGEDLSLKIDVGDQTI